MSMEEINRLQVAIEHWDDAKLANIIWRQLPGVPIPLSSDAMAIGEILTLYPSLVLSFRYMNDSTLTEEQKKKLGEFCSVMTGFIDELSIAAWEGIRDHNGNDRFQEYSKGKMKKLGEARRVCLVSGFSSSNELEVEVAKTKESPKTCTPSYRARL